jgi:Flp pilus assembly CpaF family ATPase
MSIRKFSRTAIDFAKFEELGSVSKELAKVLEIAAR